MRNDYGIFALGTIRTNRLRGAQKKLPTDKNLKKKRQRVLRTSRMYVIKTRSLSSNGTITNVLCIVHPIQSVVRYQKEHGKKKNARELSKYDKRIQHQHGRR